MNARDAKQRFEKYLSSRGEDVAKLTPEQGVEAMLGFYREVRAEGCLAVGGDMLLAQWGTYDWGDGEHFEFDLTRQLISGQGEDEDIWQLSLTFKFRPDDDLRALGSANRWCGALAEIVSFEAFIRSAHPYLLVRCRRDAQVDLRYECAG